MTDLDPQETAAKLALDTAELHDRVPELQPAATAINYREDGGVVLVLPDHPLVTALIRKLDRMDRGTADLRTARRRLRAARDSYQVRVSVRSLAGDDQPAAFNRSVSLSSILIVRAEARHWLRVVERLERDQRAKKRAERSTEIAHRVCFINGEAYPVTRSKKSWEPT